MLEIGSYEGRSTCYFIETCKQLEELHCIDTWLGGIEHDSSTMHAVESRFDRNVQETIDTHNPNLKFIKHKDSSRVVLGELLRTHRSQFDLVYVDGSHQAADVLMDAVLGFELLKLGGLIAFDDYLWHLEAVGSQDLLNMPKFAIDSFVNVYQRKLQVLVGTPLYQIYLRKTHP